ncbi:MAG: tyrosine-type recombinase/integrase [Rhodothermales bacterium]
MVKSDMDSNNTANNKSTALALKINLDTKAAQSFAQQSRSDNTKKAYKSDWKHFTEWCNERELESLPATIHTVTLYVASCADEYKVTTLERRLASISQAHKTSGHESPALVSREPLHSVWSGIVRTKSRLKEKVAPTLTEDIKLMVEHLPRLEDEPGRPLTPQGLRDRALLLLGFAGAMRRSELAGLDAEDLQFTADGLRVLIRKSKTDQEGQGQVIGIIYGSNPNTCPVRAVKSWMKAASINTGPLFSSINKHGTVGKKHLTGQSVALIIKRACLRSGLSPDLYSGHSLRAGFTTQAARAGKAERIIMRHTRHKSEKMVREYIREGDLFNESPTDSLGL